MFLGTIKALLLSTQVPDPSRRPALTVAIATGMFLILLVIRWLMEGVYRLFFNSGEERLGVERVTSDLPSAINGELATALPPAQNHGIPVGVFNSRRYEMTQPSSVTENTTELLSKP